MKNPKNLDKNHLKLEENLRQVINHTMSAKIIKWKREKKVRAEIILQMGKAEIEVKDIREILLAAKTDQEGERKKKRKDTAATNL